MDLDGSNTCCGCLNTDRKMKTIDDFWTKNCFSEIISEISSVSAGFSIRLCWECAALLHRFTRFKYQVLQSYKIFQECRKKSYPYQTLTQRLQIQKIVNIEIFPTEKNSNVEFKPIDVLKTENLDNTEELSIKEEGGFSNNEDDDDTALSELVVQKKSQVNGRREVKKKKKKSVDTEVELYIQVKLSNSQVEEDRKAMELREEYVNAMFRCERCIISFPNAEDLKDHVRIKHDLNASKFQCCICECSFGSEVSYKYHMNRHTRRYQCCVCAERFTSKRAATKHYEMVHCRGDGFDVSSSINTKEISKKDDITEESSKQKPSFPCEFCSKSFRWKTSLRKHMETHRIETGQKRKPYCEPCK